MNRLTSVADLNRSDILDGQTTKYDLAIFASGHEARASHIATLLDPSRVAAAVAFGFDSSLEEGSRLANDAVFRSRWKVEPVVLSNQAETEIYRFLTEAFGSSKRLRLLVDYSSMTRFWYAAILNWIRFREPCELVEVDFAYCAGEYSTAIPPLQINDILSIPGCEGNTASAGPSVTLLGLGFDNNSVQCVLDDIEPDVVRPFIAGGAARASYVEQVKRANEELLERCPGSLEFPLESVATTLTLLGEVVAPYVESYNISIVPLGPKPHVLASILLALTFPQVAALHVSGQRFPPWDALPTDLVIGTRIQFRPCSPISEPSAG